jgi:aryl-alcohol dehydrogenase-like predicted oxidoreductase
VGGELGLRRGDQRIRRNQETDLRRAAMMSSFQDESRLDAVEQVASLAEDAGLRMTHLALAFAIAHPGVTSALIGPRTMEHLDDLLAGVDVRLSDDVLDRLDEIVAPGTDVGAPDHSAYLPPALQVPELRRRPGAERSAA